MNNSTVISVVLRPDSGFAEVVLDTLLDFKEENQDIAVNLAYKSEYIDDFQNLPVPIQEKFYYGYIKLYRGDASIFPAEYSQNKYTLCAGQAHRRGHKGVYTVLISSIGGAPTKTVYYAEPNMKYNKNFKCELDELAWLNENSNQRAIVNLYSGFTDMYRKNNIRKRATATTYYYRLNFKMPNGAQITEEKGGFACVYHADQARVQRLKDLLHQDIRVAGKTFEDTFAEYLDTLEGKEPLKEKYRIYFNAFCRTKGIHNAIIEDLIFKEVKESYLGFLGYSNHRDGRVKDSTKTCSKAYLQGFRAMLMNLLDFAYLQGYISTQPLYYSKE